MKILIDTNILLYNEADHHPPAHLQVLIRLINDLNYRLLVHPLSITEVEKDNNIPNKHLLLARMREYSQVATQRTPIIDDTFFEKIGKPDNERDQVDNHLLYCVYKNEVDFFITEDPDIIKKAYALNIPDKVMNSKKALNYFQNRKQKKVEQGDGPVYCFYKVGEIWHIGEKGKVLEFASKIYGFECIHILLSCAHKRVSSKDMYNSIKNNFNREIINEDEEKKEENLYKSKILDEDKNINKKHVKSSHRDKNYLSPKTELIIKNRISTLKEDLSVPNSLSIDEEENKQEELQKLEKYLNDNRWDQKGVTDPDPSVNKARLNVLKAINRALGEISEKSTSSFSNHLNNEIKKGNKISYNPPLDNEPFWILHSEDLDK